MTMQLTRGERDILRKLLEIENSITASELSKEIGETKERVVSILSALSTRGLIKFEVIESPSYMLTEEGLEYSENRLPEIRLFNAVTELGGNATVDDAVAKAGLSPKAKGIAISWARKNGWLEIGKEAGTTILEAKITDVIAPVENVLLELKGGSDKIPEELSDGVKEAIERTLVTVSLAKLFRAEIKESEVMEIQSLLERPVEGVVEVTPELLISGKWKEVSFKPFNVTLTPAYANYGKKHPYAEFNDWLKEILVGLGFTEWFGPYVETEFWNFDALFVPQDHAARDEWSQFIVTEPYSHGDILDKKYHRALKAVHENGGKTGSTGWVSPYSNEIAMRLCLRAHTTPVSIRYLWEHRESPQKMFIIDRNFRSETMDARHAMEFNQCEGIIMDKALTLRDLLGYLTLICEGVGIKKIKFKPGQFPFTEPSVEAFGKHEKLGWIELGGSGIFRPEVTHPLGINDSVLAWGIGAGRLYMAAMGIDDIRDLFTRDLPWLRRAYFVK